MSIIKLLNKYSYFKILLCQIIKPWNHTPIVHNQKSNFSARVNYKKCEKNYKLKSKKMFVVILYTITTYVPSKPLNLSTFLISTKIFFKIFTTIFTIFFIVLTPSHLRCPLSIFGICGAWIWFGYQVGKLGLLSARLNFNMVWTCNKSTHYSTVWFPFSLGRRRK